MRRMILLGLALLLSAGDVLAAGSNDGDPLFVTKAQGNIRDQVSVQCSVDSALLTAAQLANARSVQCQNMETTANRRIGICPRLAAAGACDSIEKFGSMVNSGEPQTIDASATGAWSCDGVGGTWRMNCLIERFVKPSTGGPGAQPATPTPTPIPTQTPGPTPTN